MLIIFLIQQIADWITTTLALRHARGAEELNPVVRYLMRVMPAGLGLLFVKSFGIVLIGVVAKQHPHLITGFDANPLEWLVFAIMALAYSYAIFGNIRVYMKGRQRGD